LPKRDHFYNSKKTFLKQANNCQLPIGNWQLAVGSWLLAIGNWQLAIGYWQIDIHRNL